jgi:hypothetical protein
MSKDSKKELKEKTKKLKKAKRQLEKGVATAQRKLLKSQVKELYKRIGQEINDTKRNGARTATIFLESYFKVTDPDSPSYNLDFYMKNSVIANALVHLIIKLHKEGYHAVVCKHVEGNTVTFNLEVDCE